ncbi:MAG: adenylosuccinate lyase [Chlamydiae bacterium]|nr:adenylosuccinate lyase [Chlamydiota bacterium]
MTDVNHYKSSLSSRYASKEMSFLFSSSFKHQTWRKLWVALAKSQKKLGLPITDKQIEAMQKAASSIDFSKAEEYEKKFRHDVVAHIHTFADAAPESRGIIHMGATSCYVTDNTDILQMREGLHLLHAKLVQVLRNLSEFAKKHSSLATLSYTHLQAAQPTTVGKRACMWLQDFFLDLKHLENETKEIKFLGMKGATGTQSSLMQLFHGDHEKVKKLEHLICEEMGFSKVIPISGQTYTRKQDMAVFYVLHAVAISCHKFASDLRLLAHLKEIEEASSPDQIGSSAMPHKRNPMKSERVCGIARFLISLAENPAYTSATQWLERSLDDSSNRRISIPEAFLSADAILNLVIDITKNLIIYPKMIEKNLKEELPFLASENILMAAVAQGKDRQKIHSLLHSHAQDAAQEMKEKGSSCTLLDKIIADKNIGLSQKDIEKIVRVENFIGRAKEQTEEFLKEEIEPYLQKTQHIQFAHSPIEI